MRSIRQNRNLVNGLPALRRHPCHRSSGVTLIIYPVQLEHPNPQNTG